MSLAAFIKTHDHKIIDEWVKFAGTLLPAAGYLDSPQLHDHIRSLLQAIINDLETPETEPQRDEKAKGLAPETKNDMAAKAHGVDRFTVGFDIIQVFAEFRALRASIIKLWSAEWTSSNRDWTTPAQVIPDLLRFNEVIDEMIGHSLANYINVSARRNASFVGCIW